MKSADGKKIMLEVPRRLVDRRLDIAALDLLRAKLPAHDFSRGIVAHLIQAGRLTLNGIPAGADRIVKLHDVIEAFSRDFSAIVAEIRPDPGGVIDIPLVYQDDSMAVINKPAGIQVHPAGTSRRTTVAHWVIAHYPETRGVGEDALRPGIVHRLDRETSGVLVIARTAAAFQGLKQLFKNRAIEKKYITLVYGHMPALQGEIDKPIMQRSGRLKRFVVETQGVPEAARQALTSYRVLARYREFDLVEVSPKTGRTHQIRAHLASLGHPVVGDKLYAWKPMRRGEKLFSARQMLHARSLRFELLSKKYAFHAPLPEDFHTLLKSIDETRKASYDDEALKGLLSA